METAKAVNRVRRWDIVTLYRVLFGRSPNDIESCPHRKLRTKQDFPSHSDAPQPLHKPTIQAASCFEWNYPETDLVGCFRSARTIDILRPAVRTPS